jgi:penicillin-binding protein-related factor A (putative recombinase)
MRDYNEVYLLHWEDIDNFIRDNKRKSLPIDFLREYGIMILGYDYIKHLR